MSVYGGYLDNPEDTSDCRYCRYKVRNIHSLSENPFDATLQVGDEFYAPLNMEFDKRWRDLFLVLAFFGTWVLSFDRRHS